MFEFAESRNRGLTMFESVVGKTISFRAQERLEQWIPSSTTMESLNSATELGVAQVNKNFNIFE